jgi:hypothetical protein
MTDSVDRGEQAAAESVQRWITAMQSMADQIRRQQQTFLQMMQESMNTYMQLLNTLPFSLSGQSQEGQQASERWMRLAQQQQEMFRQMSQQWMEQAQQQQQAFQQMVQESLTAYTDLFKPFR